MDVDGNGHIDRYEWDSALKESMGQTQVIRHRVILQYRVCYEVPVGFYTVPVASSRSYI